MNGNEVDKSICSTISIVDTLSTKTAIACSSDDKIAILCTKHISILTLNCKPTSTDCQYAVNYERIECPKMDIMPPVQLDESLLKVSNDIPDLRYHPLLKYNARATFIFSPYTSEGFGVKEGFRIAEWSPLNVDSNQNCVLAALGHDSRISIFSQSHDLNSWSQIAELHQLYCGYYLRYGRLVYHNEPPKHLSYDQLRELQSNDDCVWCESIEEYNLALQDLTLSSISWSKIIRHYRHNEISLGFSLLVSMTKSGTLIFWNFMVPFFNEKSCSIAHIETMFTGSHLNDYTLMKVCDISEQIIMVAVSCPDGSLKMLFYDVKFNAKSGLPTLEYQMQDPLTVDDLRHDLSWPNIIEWIQSSTRLLIAKEAALYVVQIVANLTEDQFKFSLHIKSLGIVSADNNKSITGLQCRWGVIYASTEDGVILKCSIDKEGVIFENLYSPVRKNLDKFDYYGIFVSSNAVLMGILENPCTFLESIRSSKKKKIVPRVMILSKWSDDELLKLLLEERKPFHQKHDAIEELRRRYVVNRDLMKDDLMQLVETEEKWTKFSKHNLQFMKYLCQFHGQNFRENRADQPISPHQERLNEKIRKLDILLLKHHLINLFTLFKQQTIFRSQDDALLVQRIINIVSKVNEPLLRDLKSLMDTSYQFVVKLLDKSCIGATKTACSVCNLEVTADLFSASCPGQRHRFQRCCQTLTPCDLYNYRYCRNCNVQALILPENCSEWRRKVCSRYCPFCDGDLVMKF